MTRSSAPATAPAFNFSAPAVNEVGVAEVLVAAFMSPDVMVDNPVDEDNDDTPEDRAEYVAEYTLLLTLAVLVGCSDPILIGVSLAARVVITPFAKVNSPVMAFPLA